MQEAERPCRCLSRLATQRAAKEREVHGQGSRPRSGALRTDTRSSTGSSRPSGPTRGRAASSAFERVLHVCFDRTTVTGHTAHSTSPRLLSELARWDLTMAFDEARWLNQSTHSRVAYARFSRPRLGVPADAWLRVAAPVNGIGLARCADAPPVDHRGEGHELEHPILLPRRLFPRRRFLSGGLFPAAPLDLLDAGA